MRRVPIAAIAVMVTALVAAACGTPVKAADGVEGLDQPAVEAVRDRTVPPRRPNIVFVLMDDFSLDLLPTMRSARVMARRGASYENAFVVDSLCCVSRSATFTGQYPHQTGVLTNTSNLSTGRGPLGGWRSLRRPRQPGAHLRSRAAGVGLHHRLRRQVPQRLRGALAPPAAAAGAAGLVGLPRHLRDGVRRVGLPGHAHHEQGHDRAAQLAGAAARARRGRSGTARTPAP